MSRVDLIETGIKCRSHLSHSLLLLILSISYIHFTFISTTLYLSFCLHQSHSSHKIHKYLPSDMGEGGDKNLFNSTFTRRHACTPTHSGLALISDLFRGAKTKRRRSYRSERQPVSILPSLNDPNKEFNTAGPE